MARLRLIAELGRVVVSDKPVIARELAERVRIAMGVDACALRVLQGEHLVMLGSAGIPERSVPDRISSKVGLAAELIGERHPVKVFNAEEHQLTAPLHASAKLTPGHFTFHSFAGAPLMLGGRVMGALGVYMVNECREFTHMELEHLQLVANQVAIALENDRLYRETQARMRKAHTDVDVRERAERRLLQYAYQDSLTNLPNRMLFLEHAQNCIEQARHGDLHHAVVLLSLDRFHVINDMLGMDRGDQVLRAVAGTLLQFTRPGDVLARVAGDEFAFLLAEFGRRPDTAEFAARIQEELRRPAMIGGESVPVSASIGIVKDLGAYTTASELLRDAETAMHRAKMDGGAKMLAFSISMREEDRQLFDIEKDLSQAIEEEKIYLEYQPIYSAATGGVCGLEALARWNHEKLGPIPPVDFVRMAEESNLISAFGELVLRTACKHVEALNRRRLLTDPLFVSLNISAQQFSGTSFSRLIDWVLKDCGLEPHALCIEITETTLLQRPTAIIEQLERLRSKGARVFIDNFGRGYSSLSYLGHLPVDLVKIDRSYTDDVESGGRKHDLFRAIVSLSHKLGLPVLAEGVESAAQHECLRRIGVNYLQGYHLGRPMSEQDCFDQLTNPEL